MTGDGSRRERGDRADGSEPQEPTGHPELFGAPWVLRWRDVGTLVTWCAVVVAVYVALGEVIVRSPIDELDREWARAAVEARTPTGNRLAPWAAGLSDTITKIVVTAIVVAVMFRIWRRWREPLVVALALVFEATAFITVTWIVQRSRPAVERLQESPVDSSWPSGHVAAAAAYGAIALVVVRHLRSPSARFVVWMIPVAVTAIVAVARWYQAMHYVSDIVAGVALGVVSVVIVDRTIPATAASPRLDDRTGLAAFDPPDHAASDTPADPRPAPTTG